MHYKSIKSKYYNRDTRIIILQDLNERKFKKFCKCGVCSTPLVVMYWYDDPNSRTELKKKLSRFFVERCEDCDMMTPKEQYKKSKENYEGDEDAHLFGGPCTQRQTENGKGGFYLHT